MTAPAPVEIPEPIYRYYATSRESGPCTGGCGGVILPGELMAKYRDVIRCASCAERWPK